MMGKFGNSIANDLSNVKKAVKIIWSASPKYFIGKMILSVLLVVVAYIPIRLWRDLLNALTDFVRGADGSLFESVGFFTSAYCLVLLLQRILNTLSANVSYRYHDEVSFYVDSLLVDKISGADMSFFDSSKLADHLLNTTQYMSYTLQRIVQLIFSQLQGVAKIVISFGLIFALDARLIPFLMLLSIPSVVLGKHAKAESYQFNKTHRNSQRKLDYYKSLLFEKSRLEVKVYDLSDFLEEKYSEEWDRYHGAQRKLNIKNGMRTAVSMIFIAGTEIVAYIFAISKLVSKAIGVGEVSYYITISNKFRDDLISMVGGINEFRQLSLQLDDIMVFEQMRSEADQRGRLIAPKLPKIEFDDVSFRYPGSDRYILERCSFTIHPGETIGLVGLNGSGKSTVVKLLLQFYQPESGQIRIDGVDAREYDLHELRKRFGVLFQDYCKYSFTLRENIALADISRIRSDREIYEACRLSKVTDFISDWEQGLDEELTRKFHKQGKELSGGQWQRVSLARAFFRDASCLLLDEPSAALDPVAEHEIFEDISRLSEKKSAVLISHRLSNITLTDRILVLEGGQIVEQGTHDELIRAGGKYAHLFSLQAGKYM